VYMKYQDRFEQLEELGNPTMGRFMLSEVLTKMATTCKSCQRDRMRCTIQPLCSDRVFLNILIVLGARVSDLPTFCYQVHLRTLQSYLQSGAKRDHPKEPRYPLRHFRRHIQFKKDDPDANFQAFTKFLETTTKQEVYAYKIDNTWYFGVGKGIFIVDVRHGLVSLDPDGDIIRREALEPILTFLTDLHQVQGDLLKDMQDTWYFRVSIPKLTKEEFNLKIQPKLEELATLWAFVRATDVDKETQILVGLDPAPDKVIRLQGLRQTVQILADFTKASGGSGKTSSTKSEKSTATV
jgi:hypothetical protein